MTSELLISRNIALVGEEIADFQSLIEKLYAFTEKPVGFVAQNKLILDKREVEFIKDLYHATIQDGIEFATDDHV